MAKTAVPSFEDLDWNALKVRLGNLASPGSLSRGGWPAAALAYCGEMGVLRAMNDPEGWNESEIIRAYLELSQADLTTTFILTQYLGACRRIRGSANSSVADHWLESLVSGERFTTVGISHLTTSRRHLATPVLRAQENGKRWIVDGYSPWVTGGAYADLLVVGATLDDGREILAAIPASRPGIIAGQGASLVALSGSCTDRVEFHDVIVEPDEVLAGPIPDVMSTGVGAGTGGLQTSTLALGLSLSAIDFLKEEASKREELLPPTRELQRTAKRLEEELIQTALGQSRCSTAELRTQANSLALHSTQAALTAAKGAGFVQGHAAGRWCCEALFFLVWSCPQPVVHAHLCELAGL
jgi:alkylation response protein AidB-like acyl-CoA dehydrogenase